MRNANKCLEIPYSAMARKKWKSNPESVSRTGLLPEVNQFFRLVGPTITPSFNEGGKCCDEVDTVMH